MQCSPSPPARVFFPSAIALALALVTLPITGRAQQPDALRRFGTVATLAPLCAARDETWSFDLRRAELQAATGSARFDDEALKSAPGSGRAAAALGDADLEATETFAEAPPAVCSKLTADPDLGRADEIVRAFRAQRNRQPGT